MKKSRQVIKRRRPRYYEVHGKVVDFVETKFEEGLLYLHIRFVDKTEMSFALGSQVSIRHADLSDISTGNYKTIKEYATDES